MSSSSSSSLALNHFLNSLKELGLLQQQLEQQLEILLQQLIEGIEMLN